jgi:hypothetical protein
VGVLEALPAEGEGVGAVAEPSPGRALNPPLRADHSRSRRAIVRGLASSELFIARVEGLLAVLSRLLLSARVVVRCSWDSCRPRRTRPRRTRSRGSVATLEAKSLQLPRLDLISILEVHQPVSSPILAFDDALVADGITLPLTTASRLRVLLLPEAEDRDRSAIADLEWH